MGYILGISAFYHDSSAALLKDGEILSAAQEERFTRIKHDQNFPTNTIRFILKNNNLTLSQIDKIVFYEKPFLKFERLLETYIAFVPHGFRSFAASIPIWLREKLFQKKLLIDELKKIDNQFQDKNKIKFSEHHLSHAASAFYPSPFDEAIILTLDGVGEWATTTISIGKENKINILKEINFPHSIGLLYSAFTYYLGFKVNSGEYKVMGLAPYGEPRYKNLILDNLIDVKKDGSFKINMKYFNYATGLTMVNKKFENLFGNKIRKPEDELLQIHMDIASSLQKVTEEIILKICQHISSNYKIKNLCLSGGVALNCVANGKILKNQLFDNIWIQPASGDAGGSLGAAYAYWFNEKNNKRVKYEDQMKGSYFGPSFKNDEIEQELKKLNAVYSKYEFDEIYKKTAKLISEGKAVGWFQGRMEYGPRALGNRSSVADPRLDDMQKNLNLKIKFRESFRPFAPSVLKEKASEYFDLKCESPYMLLTTQISEHLKINKENQEKYEGIDKLNFKRSELQAITHVDYSARVQTVSKEFNEKFYKLIREFYDLTGCPVLINTSFNIRGEPIVCTPADAYRCFMGTDLDCLVCENFILNKEDQIKNNLKDYRNNFELD